MRENTPPTYFQYNPRSSILPESAPDPYMYIYIHVNDMYHIVCKEFGLGSVCWLPIGPGLTYSLIQS